MGLGTKSDDVAWIAFIDSNSPWTIFLPVSPGRTFMKKDDGVPSASSTSMRPVLAKKLVPWGLTVCIRQSLGSALCC